MGVVGCAGLARQIGAFERERPGRCSRPNDAPEHIVHEVGIALVNDPKALVTGQLRMRLREQAALAIDDTLDQPGLDPVAVVGEHGIGAGHLPEGHRACAERHGEIGRMAFGVESEPGDIVLRIARTDRL